MNLSLSDLKKRLQATNLWGLLARQADEAKIVAILNSEGFIFSNADAVRILKGHQEGQRYGSAVLTRRLPTDTRQRFIKVLLDGTLETFRPFRRQVLVTDALHRAKHFDGSTVEVVKYSFLPPLPYAIFETRDSGGNFGFMDDTAESYSSISPTNMQQLVQAIYSFHNAAPQIQGQALKSVQKLSSRLSFYQRKLEKTLDKTITHKTEAGRKAVFSVEELLVKYTRIPNIRSRIISQLAQGFERVEKSCVQSQQSYLVHADMQIDNVYKYRNGSIELLDFEWVGIVDSPMIAIMYDYGNLRTRAWSSPEFQRLLDETMLRIGINVYPDQRQMVTEALRLGRLFSSTSMSRYFLDYENTIKNDKRTEQQYYQMYANSTQTLKQTLDDIS